ncbi:MAG: hypothetical protein AAB071_04625 [Bacteroidota bacterium]
MKKLFSLLFFLTTFAYAQQDSVSLPDSLLLQQPEQSVSQSQYAGTTTRTIISMNPDISAIGDFRSTFQSASIRKVESYLHALEVQLSSVIDPFATAHFLFSFGKDFTTNEYVAGLEEGTITSTSLPMQLQLKLGKFKPQFGKINALHPHAFSCVNFPRVNELYFSDEGMFMDGLSLSWLVPNPFDFFQELNIYVGRPEENGSFVNGGATHLFSNVHLKNFFDLSDNSTIELGISGLTGQNSFNFTTTMGNFDATYKWKPVQFNTYYSFTFQSEIYYQHLKYADALYTSKLGAYSFLEYQIEKLWFIGARFDYTELPVILTDIERSIAFLFRLQPSEFQILALQFQHTERTYAESDNQILFRIIFGIGTHAAHPY